MSNETNLQSGINVAALERELTSLWKGAGEESEEGGVIRACVLNLLVYVPSETASSEVDEILTEVAASHPSRAILLAADRAAAESSLAAWVTSRCTLPNAHSKQVCCEQITITARGDQVNEAPSAVAPLLLSDLPVYLWWRDEPRLADKVFKRLVEIADRVVIDSAAFTDPHGDLLSLAVFQRDTPRWTAISDLNWARLTDWRLLLASFYDVADYRPFLDGLDRIVIEYAPLPHHNAALVPRALLLAGWLASRLGWQLNDSGTIRRGGSAIFELNVGDGSGIIEFAPVRHHEVAPGHLARVTLTGLAGTEASFQVRKSTDGNRLETEVVIAGEPRIGRVLSYVNLSESVLIGRELELLGHDRIYERAVVSAGEMVAALIQA
jgi:glucose-6-phosphate dehydrogenase assembly protein OpcA